MVPRFKMKKQDLILVDGYLVMKNGKPWHRKVCRSFFGPFRISWVVHHIDANKVNNDPMNLIALPEQFHSKLHYEARKVGRLPNRTEIERRLIQWLSLTKKQNAKIPIVTARPLYSHMPEIRPKVDPNLSEREQIEEFLRKRKLMEAIAID